MVRARAAPKGPSAWVDPEHPEPAPESLVFGNPATAPAFVRFGERVAVALAEYGRPTVVLEHRACDAGNPGVRPRRLLAHTLATLHDAVDCGADIRGYAHWSLLDNLEWCYGFSARFGFFRVDHRTDVQSATTSADYYRRVIAAQPAGDSTWVDRR